MAKPYPTHFLSESRRKSEMNFTCSQCRERWIESEMRFQDGIESDPRCPNCYEENGGAVARDLDRAAAAEIAAALEVESATPPKRPGWYDDLSHLASLNAFSSSPMLLHAGGAAAALTITGTGFVSDDTISYGHAGITNSVAPAITATEVVLTVQASGGVPYGSYSLIYNDVTYRNVFDVRA